MKLLILPLLLLATALPLSALTTPPAVLDTDGKELIAGQEYFIVPLLPTQGGGLTLESSPNTSCPAHVVQDYLGGAHDIPVIFSTIKLVDMIVRESTDVIVLFSAPGTPCGRSEVWKVVESVKERKKQQFVEIGGIMASPQNINVLFKIVKYGATNYYKLKYCPTYCRKCGSLCQELGMLTRDGRSFLGLGGVNFPIMFKIKNVQP